MNEEFQKPAPSRRSIKKRAIITLVVGLVLAHMAISEAIVALLTLTLSEIYAQFGIELDVFSTRITAIVEGSIFLVAAIVLIVYAAMNFKKMKGMPVDAPKVEPEHTQQSFWTAQENFESRESRPEPKPEPTPEPKAEQSPEEALKELEQAHAEGRISDAEFYSRRADILKEMGY